METYQNNIGGLDFLIVGVTEQELTVTIRDSVIDQYSMIRLHWYEGDLSVHYDKDNCRLDPIGLRYYMNDKAGEMINFAELARYITREGGFKFL